jgi:hypothetical protein
MDPRGANLETLINSFTSCAKATSPVLFLVTTSHFSGVVTIICKKNIESIVSWNHNSFLRKTKEFLNITEKFALCN